MAHMAVVDIHLAGVGGEFGNVEVVEAYSDIFVRLDRHDAAESVKIIGLFQGDGKSAVGNLIFEAVGPCFCILHRV